MSHGRRDLSKRRPFLFAKAFPVTLTTDCLVYNHMPGAQSSKDEHGLLRRALRTRGNWNENWQHWHCSPTAFLKLLVVRFVLITSNFLPVYNGNALFTQITLIFPWDWLMVAFAGGPVSAARPQVWIWANPRLFGQRNAWYPPYPFRLMSDWACYAQAKDQSWERFDWSPVLRHGF